MTRHLSFALPSLPWPPALAATFTRLSSNRICQTKTIPRQAKTALVYTHQSCSPLHTPETVIHSAISTIPPRISTFHTIRLPIRPPINRARSSTVQAPIDTPQLRLTTTLPESICTHRASLGPLSTFDIRHQHHIHDNHPSRQIINTLRHSSSPQWNVLYLHQPVPWPVHPNAAQWPPPPHPTPPAPIIVKRSQQRSSLAVNAAAVKSDATQRVPCATTVSADQTSASMTQCQNVEAPINAPEPVSAHVRSALQTGVCPLHQRGKE